MVSGLAARRCFVSGFAGQQLSVRGYKELGAPEATIYVVVSLGSRTFAEMKLFPQTEIARPSFKKIVLA